MTSWHEPMRSSLLMSDVQIMFFTRQQDSGLTTYMDQHTSSLSLLCSYMCSERVHLEGHLLDSHFLHKGSESEQAPFMEYYHLHVYILFFLVDASTDRVC